VTAVGISATPIRWEKDPHRTARVVIFILAPIRDAALYLQVVGAFARTLAHPDTVLGLLAARTPDQVVALAALDKVELPSQLTVRDVMTAQAITVGPDRTLGDVARLMVEHDIRALPVVDDGGSLIGMITHRELLRFLIRTSSSAPRPESFTRPRAPSCSAARPTRSSFRQRRRWLGPSSAWRRTKRSRTSPI